MTTVNAGRTPATFSTASLYVGDLHSEICEQHLFEKFSSAGAVLSIRVCRDAITRRSLGYAYVNFQQTVDAERALETLNFELLYGKPMRIMWCQRDPAMRRSGSGNIFIKNLDKTIDNKSIFDTFSMFGNILSCKVALDGDGRSKGYAFVHFETEDSAMQAIEKVNGMLLEGKKVYVGKFIPRATRVLQLGDGLHKFTNVFVKNFADELDQKKFEELFSKFGDITSAVVMTDIDGKSKGFGFVAFKNPEDAAKAVEEMQDFELPSGRKLSVCRALKKRERSAELKRRFELLKAERQQHYHGVNLYVKNLDDSFSDEKLREEFEKFGNITSAKVMLDECGRSKGFGFVCFENAESADKAIEALNGKIVGSKPLYVGRAQRKEERKAQLASMFMQNMASARYRNVGIVPTSIYPQSSAPMYVAPQVASQRPATIVASVPTQLRPAAPRWSALGAASSNIGIPPQYFVQGFGQLRRPVDMAHAAVHDEGMIRGQGYSNDVRSRFPSTSSNVLVQQQRSSIHQVEYKFPVAKELEKPSMRMNVNLASQRDAHLDSLNAYNLAQATPEQQKQILGERLYPLVGRYLEPGPDQGKITGMMLDMEPSELLMLLENEDELRNKVAEAVHVLNQAKADAARQ